MAGAASIVCGALFIGNQASSSYDGGDRCDKLHRIDTEPPTLFGDKPTQKFIGRAARALRVFERRSGRERVGHRGWSGRGAAGREINGGGEPMGRRHRDRVRGGRVHELGAGEQQRGLGAGLRRLEPSELRRSEFAGGGRAAGYGVLALELRARPLGLLGCPPLLRPLESRRGLDGVQLRGVFAAESRVPDATSLLLGSLGRRVHGCGSDGWPLRGEFTR